MGRVGDAISFGGQRGSVDAVEREFHVEVETQGR